MRVLILSQHFWPESFRINQVASDLVDAGCQVTVLTGQPNYPEGSIYPGYRAGEVRREQRDRITIHRVPLVPRARGGAVRLAANYLSFLLSACVLGPWVLRGQRFDVVFVYGTSPILQAIAGVVLKVLKRAPLVVWVQDLWPESLRVTGFVRNRRALAAVALVVRWIYRRSDLLLVQSHAFEAPVRAMAGRTPVEYHPNPGEPDGAPRADVPEVPLESGAFNVVFAGNLGTVQALPTILDAAERLQSLRDLRIVLVGSGSRSAWLQEEVARRGLSNVHLPGKFPTEAMPSLMQRASALLVTLAREPILAQTVPSKVQTYLAAGRPIVACLDGEGAAIVRDSGAGFVCDAEDAAALAAAIQRLHAASDAERAELGASGRRYYLNHFDPRHLAERLARRMDQLKAGRR
ncbi:glycosyltransferase family 4 protein [Ramlibacter algicola]|uniref:Glycosyltransferase family 4 protein n=1 Tax=Ramlibacter algicola TaxID=2795217 RepID=A0A934PZF6_9BURK|nr:glycosyltransferase family 4 protein [Ramlibacter algicola]MBK0391951.1 glycosyltransferase family 4 protein [Ramlibacter algicola]